MQRVASTFGLLRMSLVAGLTIAMSHLERMFASSVADLVGYKLSALAVAFLIILAAVFVFKVAEWTLGRALLRSEYIRGLFFGSDDLEGTWVDVVFDDEKKIVSYGEIQIELDLSFGATYQIDGFGVTRGGVKTGNTFRSTASAYEARMLIFGFDVEQATGDRRGEGDARYKFSGPKSLRPDSFDGSFRTDAFRTETKLFRVKGKRLAKGSSTASAEAIEELIGLVKEIKDSDLSTSI